MMETEQYRKQCHGEAVEKLKRVYHERNPLVTPSTAIQRVSECMESYSAVLLSEIAEKLAINSLSLLEYAAFDYGWDEVNIRDALHLADALSEYYGRYNDDHLMVNAHLTALKHYEGLCPQQSDEYPDLRVTQAQAIIKVTKYLENSVDVWVYFENDIGARPYISDADLRALLTAPDTDLETVVHLIRERHVLDADALRVMAQAATEPSLTSGVL